MRVKQRMDELDVIRSIANHLSERKRSAALSNYRVLCNTIRSANGLFDAGVQFVKRFAGEIESLLKLDENVVDNAKPDTSALFYFRRITPVILRNDLYTLEKFLNLTRADDRSGVTIESLEKVKRDFDDFNNLTTAARQLFDSLTANAYQLILLDAKETNYQVLRSLRSFYRFATESLVHLVFHPDLEDSLREFESLSIDQQLRGAESDITRCASPNFTEKVGVLFTSLGLQDYGLLEKIDSIFKFSSDFTHIGYVPSHLMGANVSEVVFGDEDGPYLPSTENFSELKYEFLTVANQFLTDVYLPSLIVFAEQLLRSDRLVPLKRDLEEIRTSISAGMALHFRDYFFPIRDGLIGSSETIDLQCKCGHVRKWAPPHEESERFCENCGSTFGIIVLEGGGGYIMTSEGPIRILGSSEPPISEDERARLMAEYFPTFAPQKEAWSDQHFSELQEAEKDIISTLVHVGAKCDQSLLESVLDKYNRELLISTVQSLEERGLVFKTREGFLQAANFLSDAAANYYPKV
jgi:hypothetical protein